MIFNITPSKSAAFELEEFDVDRAGLIETFTVYEDGEKDGEAAILAIMRECPAVCWRAGTPTDCGGRAAHRNAKNVAAVTGIAFDIDDVTDDTIGVAIERFKSRGVFFIAYETHSHDAEGSERGEPVGRYRVVIPFKEPLPIANPAQWSHPTRGAWRALAEHFGVSDLVGMDAKCKDPARLFYLPRKPQGEKRAALTFDGVEFDAIATLGDLSKRVAPTKPVEPRPSSETEDPSRMFDLNIVRERLIDTPNDVTRELARRALKGEALEKPDSEPNRERTRHEAWWLLLGRLSIVAEEWMASEALLQIVKPSWHREVEQDPTAHTPWDDGRDSVVEMFNMQRATAPTRRAEYEAQRQIAKATARAGIERFLRARGESLPTARVEDEGEAQAEPEPEVTEEELEEALEKEHLPNGGVRYKGTFDNLMVLLSMSPAWRDGLRKNAFTNTCEFWPCEAMPMIREPTPFSLKLLTEMRFVLARAERHAMRVPRDEVVAVAEWAAASSPYDPVVEFLRGLKWDGVPRLRRMLIDHFNARVEDPDGTDLTDYLESIGTRWMISAVARALEPGCKADSMLQIEGKQGIGKSTALKVLGGAWYTEAKLDFESKDTANIISASWIVELGELTSFNRASEETQKAFLARDVDTVVQKFEKYRTDLKRRCVFAGTTNKEDYLTDVTGNRRHWAFYVESEIDLAKLRRDRDQLWAEAVHLYNAGERWYLTKAEEGRANTEATKRVQGDMRDEMIADWFMRKAPEQRPRHVTTLDVAKNMLNDDKGATRKRLITDAMRRLGFEPRTVRIGTQIVRRWITPDSLLSMASARSLADMVAERIGRKTVSEPLPI